MREVFSATDVRVGDVVTYPAILRAEHKDTRSAPLRVSRVADHMVWGYAEGDPTEYAVYPQQIADNGLLVE